MSLSRESRVRMINIRNPVIVARYYYWYYIKMRRDALIIMQNREFFLTEITMERIVIARNDLLNEHLRRSKRSMLKELKEKYKSFDWTCTSDDIANN